MLKEIKYIAIIISIIVSCSGYAQDEENNCFLSLKEAEKLYDQGKLELVYPTLSNCLNDGFTKEEKVQAYRLLVLTYLFDDKTQKAEQNMEFLLED